MIRKFAVLTTLALAAGVSAAADDTRALEIVQTKCYLCHGMNGEGSSAVYPRLAAQNATYIARQLADFKSGKRKGTMNEMAADLTPEEMTALGDYFASQPPQAHRVRDQEFAAVGLYLYHNGNSYSGVPACASCHGAEGKGTTELPRLAGQHKRYVIDQLQAFSGGSRTNAVMHSIASNLTEFEVQALAQYISGMN